jgi:hypothetical protein
METTNQIAGQASNYSLDSFEASKKKPAPTTSGFLSLIIKDRPDATTDNLASPDKSIDLSGMHIQAIISAQSPDEIQMEPTVQHPSQQKENKLDLLASSNSNKVVRSSAHKCEGTNHLEQLDAQPSIVNLHGHAMGLENDQTKPKGSIEVQLLTSPLTPVRSSERSPAKTIKTGHSVSVESRVSARKELYEQSAFAVNKLSYLDTSSNLARLKVQQSLANTENSNTHLMQYSEYSEVKAHFMTSENLNSALTSQSIVPLSNQVARGKSVPSGSSAIFANNLQLLEKDRVTLTSNSNEHRLYLRDHFSSDKQLDDSIKSILQNIKLKISKIFINGKER